MKNNPIFRSLIFSLLAAVLLPLASLAAPKKKPAPPPAIAKLVWLAGNWRLEKNSELVDEQWMLPAGGVMLGMARSIEKGKIREFAFLQIREGPGGSLFFVRQVSGQKEAAFQVKALTENSVVFENQLQDYPQTVSYSLQPDGSVVAAIEGMGPDGQTKRIETSYHRTTQ